MKNARSARIGRFGWLLPCLLLASGCGTTVSQMVSDQLLVSDAVDRSVSDLNFHRLAGRKVFLDTRYISEVKGIGFVNSNYIISSLRQQLVAANCMLQDTAEAADIVVEARIGALGTDGHEIIYGMPANNTLNAATSLIPNAPLLPSIPEISVAKRNDKLGAAKLAVFAYDQKTKERVWQSGTSVAASTKRDFWIMGAGPFQRGSIYEGTKFAGSEIYVPFADGASESEPGHVVFSDEKYFSKKGPSAAFASPVKAADYEQLVPLRDSDADSVNVYHGQPPSKEDASREETSKEINSPGAAAKAPGGSKDG